MLNGSDVSIEELVRRQTPGLTLEQPFYTDAAIFERDVERIVARQWLFVDHASRIPGHGDYIAYEIAGESIILVRGGDGEVRAFFNLCRHRGSRICLKKAGTVRKLACPYHAWVYDLEGNLVAAKNMPEVFDAADWPLHRCRVRVWNGLMFINLAEEGDPEVIDFADFEKALGPYLDPGRLESTRIAHTEVYPTEGNWKLAVENFRECYHCAPAHPEYTRVNAYVHDNVNRRGERAKEVAAWEKTWAARGRAVIGVETSSTDVRQPHGCFRQPIRDGTLTLSEDGRPVAPLLGELDEFDGGESMLVFGPLFYVYLCNDHVTLFRFTPMSATHTEVLVSWLVREDAVEGRDYDVGRLKWMWDVTTVQDTRIIGDNQLGVNSRRYQPGPYAAREGWTDSFTRWYLDRIG